MVTAPSLWGLIPLFLFIVLIFRKWNPIAAIGGAIIVGAVMSGASLMDVATVIAKNGMTDFVAYIGLVILAGGGLGKIAEKTGVARNIVSFILKRVGINSPNKAMVSTMIASCVLSALLGTLAGANAIIAPVLIPVVAAAGLSSSVVAILFHGAAAAGLLLGPFTPPMVTLMELTGLSYPQVLVHAGLPYAIVLLIVTFVYSKVILKKSLKDHAYPIEDANVHVEEQTHDPRQVMISKQATAAFLITLIGAIIYGITVKGGANFTIVVILLTAIVTGLAGRMNPNQISETFVEGAKPLLWIFLQFVLFTPFIYFIEKMGGFEALKNLLLPLVESSGQTGMIIISTLVNVAGIPGAAVAHSILMHKMFLPTVTNLHVPMSIWALALLVGSQMPSFLYPTGDAIGAMGLARSNDLKNVIIFGVVATVAVMLLVIVYAFLL
ncbi:SLC13 family permease [uncultured Brevibacillus sp.]|uniref:SLC13 family permease n=1 Tax=uncultured Brevibacillus sp. TaxID=169970 RepID=UPI002591782B|nr:SLC13 family permease [uncultured Brevibacillus sp.]